MLKVEYLCDKFVDFKNTEREFILAAISIPIDGSVSMDFPISKELDKLPWFMDVTKCLAIGMSIRHNDDKYDTEIGKKIAVGKALKGKGKYLVVTDSGTVNTKMVTALLQQEAEYFKRNPEAYIAGYSKAKKKWQSGEHSES